MWRGADTRTRLIYEELLPDRKWGIVWVKVYGMDLSGWRRRGQAPRSMGMLRYLSSFRGSWGARLRGGVVCFRDMTTKSIVFLILGCYAPSLAASGGIQRRYLAPARHPPIERSFLMSSRPAFRPPLASAKDFSHALSSWRKAVERSTSRDCGCGCGSPNMVPRCSTT